MGFRKEAKVFGRAVSNSKNWSGASKGLKVASKLALVTGDPELAAGLYSASVATHDVSKLLK